MTTRRIGETLYPAGNCVLLPKGLGWPDDNARPGVGAPDDFGSNSIGYRDRDGRTHSRVYVVGKQQRYWVPNNDIEPFDPTVTGPRTDPKICLSCCRLKPLTDFPTNQHNQTEGNITRPRCSQCFTAESGGRGLTTKTRREYREQSGAPRKGDLWRCPVCRKVSIADVNVKIVVDHDHATRTPRGLLCESCNTGLGRFKNGEEFLEDAQAYLRNFDAERQS